MATAKDSSAAPRLPNTDPRPHPAIPLVQPFTPDQPRRPGYIVVVANDGQTRFECNAKAFRFYSKFAQAVLSEDESEEVPLDSDRATVPQLQRFCTWLSHHETVKVSKIPIPIPRLLCVDDYFTDPWDLAFIRQHYVGLPEELGGRLHPHQEGTNCRQLWSLILLSTYLQVEPLTNMLSCFLAYHMKEVASVSEDPLSEIAKWTGHSSEYTAEELSASMEWCKATLKGVEVPERRSMESDDEYTVAAPCEGAE